MQCRVGNEGTDLRVLSCFLKHNSGPFSFPLKPLSVLGNVFDVMYHNCCRIFAWATTHRVLAASGNTRVKQVVAAAKATSTVPSQAPPLKSATAVLLLLQLLAH